MVGLQTFAWGIMRTNEVDNTYTTNDTFTCSVSVLVHTLLTKYVKKFIYFRFHVFSYMDTRLCMFKNVAVFN